MGAAIPAVNYGLSSEFTLGVEEELLLVDRATHALDHGAVGVLERMSVAEGDGGVHPDYYAAMIELVAPICSDAAEAVTSLNALRARARAVGATAIGAGLHPTGAFGDVIPYPAPRYHLIADEMRGLQARTPTCALHVHVGMPDEEAAIRAFNGVREHLPLLQALAANSPFWHGRDSGLASARAQMFRALPRSEIPMAFQSFDEYAESVEALATAGELPDYTYLWWDVRPHPVLGTIEVRSMDAQSSLRSITGLAALVHALARRAAEEHGPWERREVLMESSFRAARDGLAATIWHDGAMRPVPEVARAAINRARPYARELGSEAALEEVERLLVEGNGAMRQRVAFSQGGMRGVLAALVRETAAQYRPAASAHKHRAHSR
ncbi:MAG: carboxylate-amine ligase [Solirubrobacteraceae bacterium]